MNTATDRLQPVSPQQLLRWIRDEHRLHGSVFGIPADVFYRPESNTWSWAGCECALPLGPAAGPHTQLAQNIIAAYLCGGRFFELKTVQKQDQLEITKPCIDGEDECYNSEWSTELSLEQAWTEYAKAWLLLPLLKSFFRLGDHPRPDHIFNLSVGYDLAGIQSPGVDAFIEGMSHADAFPRWNELRDTIAGELHDGGWSTRQVADWRDAVRSSGSRLSDSITLSTMHGCPPEEIEAIARYLLEEKKLHTYIKLNPTLLGEQAVRRLLTDCGFGYLELKGETFANDLGYEAGVAMLRRLQGYAREKSLLFGVKLSNTLPVVNRRGILPGEEVYLSGRALHPLTLQLAARLAAEFEGELPISFAGGASALNLAELLATGIQPVTVVTDLLKPGGYLRLRRMAEAAQSQLDAGLPERIDPDAVSRLAEASVSRPAAQKSLWDERPSAFATALPWFDCRITPCREGCPIQQDIPGYIRLLEQGRAADALALILATNPLPHITGYICDHICTAKCTRRYYDEPVLIRDIKRLAAEAAADTLLPELTVPPPSSASPVAVIGAGPAGLAAASFLRRTGVPVTLFEQRERPGGVVQHVIPSFRLPEEAINRDLCFLERLGVEFVFEADPALDLDRLRAEGFDRVVLAVGAEASRPLELEGDSDVIHDALSFLAAFRHDPERPRLGRRVAVIGGGNSAMDSARAALRVPGVEEVTIIYRRTAAQMPADREEFLAARTEGIGWRELLAPVALKAGRLSCQPLRLTTPDADGRPGVEPASEPPLTLPCDTVIVAVGEVVNSDTPLLRGVTLTPAGAIAVDPETLATSREGVFAVGDARRGPATVVEAIADGRRAAESILKELDLTSSPYATVAPAAVPEPAELNRRRVAPAPAGTTPLTEATLRQEASRCLACDQLCNRCVDVCPNRANVAIDVSREDVFRDHFQILHLEGLCNECGNCVTFCPHAGAPWREKPTLYSSTDTFAASTGNGFLPLGSATGSNRNYRLRLGTHAGELTLKADGTPLAADAAEQLLALPPGAAWLKLLQIVQTDYAYLLQAGEKETG